MNNITDTYCSLKDPGVNTAVGENDGCAFASCRRIKQKDSQCVFRAVLKKKKTFSPDPCVLNALSSLLESPQIKDESLQ